MSYPETPMGNSDFPVNSDDTDDASNAPNDGLTAIYARQSRASRSSYSSCEAQIAICHELAMERGFQIADSFSDDGQSSETLDRPELTRMLGAIDAGEVTRLIVYSLDRLSRRLIHLHTLLDLFDRHGLELLVITDPHFGNSAANRLMTNIVASASEFQQALNRERMADRRAALKQRGKRVAGRIPFGYQADPVTKTLTPHPDQSVIVRDFFELASKGARPSDLASLANLNGWKNHKGETGKWTPRWIIQLLKNRTYLGEIRDADSTLPGEHPAIVKPAAFDAAQRQLSARRTRPARRRDHNAESDSSVANLLGRLYCGQCNRPMSTSVSHRGSVRYYYYRCRSNSGGRPPCPGVNLSVDQLESVVCEILADENAGYPELPQAFHDQWRQMDQRDQQLRLKHVVDRVIYHNENEQVTIRLRDDFSAVLPNDLDEIGVPSRSNYPVAAISIFRKSLTEPEQAKKESRVSQTSNNRDPITRDLRSPRES